MRESIQDWSTAFLRAAVIVLLLFYFCWPMRLLGSSMEPTMGDGQIVLMSRVALLAGECKRGDIVIFSYRAAEGKQTVVKRVIATAGDHVRIDGNGVEINGERLKEAYAMGQTYGLVDLVVPEGTVYVLGDNREESYDSRNMGVIAEKDLRGKVIFCIFPPDAFGVVN